MAIAIVILFGWHFTLYLFSPQQGETGEVNEVVPGSEMLAVATEATAGIHPVIAVAGMEIKFDSDGSTYTAPKGTVAITNQAQLDDLIRQDRERRSKNNNQ